MAAPFTRAAEALFVSDARIHGVFWGDDHTAIVHDSQAKPLHVRWWRIDPSRPGTPEVVLDIGAGQPGIHSYRRPNGGRCSGRTPRPASPCSI